MRSLAIFLITLTSLLGASISFSAPIISFHSEQDLTNVRPRHDKVSISLDLPKSNKAGIKSLRVKLLAPPSQIFFSTDFPAVEGSTLFDSVISFEEGSFKFSFVPPIRGEYRLEVIPVPVNQGSLQKEEWRFKIQEDPSRVTNLGFFLLILGLVCGLSAYVIGAAEGKKANLLAQASVLVFLILASPLIAHEQHSPHKISKENMQAEGSDGLKLDLRLSSEQPRVGETAELRGTLLDANNQLIPARFHLTFMQMEHDLEVFSTDLLSSEGQFSWNGQFVDGSPHRVEVEAFPTNEKLKPIKASFEVGVQAVPPPLAATGKSFSSLMLFAALAMLSGFFLGHYKQSRIKV